MKAVLCAVGAWYGQEALGGRRDGWVTLAVTDVPGSERVMKLLDAVQLRPTVSENSRFYVR